MIGEVTDQQARWQRVCAVLDAVFDAPDHDRERVLAKHCAGDADLRAQVQAMLAAEATTDRRVDTPAAEWAGEVLDEVEPEQAQTSGEMIGEYCLVRELGRGGMGAVWLAERSSTEFQQRVALKLLKRGLDTDAVLTRFYEERRILARLRHPHIALFLDGGVSDSGQPWFTMEWVDGAPITKWCDARKLGLRERVVLFLDVVGAVQYAHQQLIVHRDLKPGNVLVSESGEVKLLDFGIAKMLDAAEGSAQAATMTRMGVRMLTPEYAAPEQLRGDPATTATDVYALGVLLYELLAGKRPISKSRDVTDAPISGPSNQVDDAAAAARGTSTERLRRQLRGDLNTIILKALNSEASRRYGSAQALGEDLQRWLDGLPVQARPDSRWYRTRRFIARHRVGTAAAAVMVLSLTTGIIVATWQAREANRQAQEARRQTLEAEKQTKRAEQVKDFLIGIFRASSPEEWEGKDPTARDLLKLGAQRLDEELVDDPLLRAQMQKVIGEIATSNGDFEQAETLLRTSISEVRRLVGVENKDYADALHAWANLLYLKGDYQNATQVTEHVVRILRNGYQQHADMTQALGMLSNLRYVSGQVNEAIDLRKEAVAITRRAQGAMPRNYAEHLLELGNLLIATNRTDEARPWLDESLEVFRKLYGADSVRFADALNGQARLLDESGDLEQAANRYGEAAEIYRKARGYRGLAQAATNRGLALCRMGRFAQAERSFGVALQVQERFPSQFHIDTLKRTYGRCLSDAGWYSKAEPFLRESVSVEQGSRPVDRNSVLGGVSIMLRLLVRQGRISDAISLIERVEDSLKPIRSTDSANAAVFFVAASSAWFMAGDRVRAITVLREAIQNLRQANAPVRAISSSVLDLAELELQSGRAQQAERSLRQVGNTIDGGRDGPLGLRVQLLRGVTQMQLGRLNESEQLLRSVLDARAKMYGQDNVWTGEVRLYLGLCVYRAGRTDEGKRLIQQGRNQFVRESGENHFVVRLADAVLKDNALR